VIRTLARRLRPGRRLLAGTSLLVLLAFALDRAFPPPLPGAGARPASVVVAHDGTPLRAFPDERHVWRHTIALDEVSPLYLEALVQYEDRAFWWHPGVNPWAMGRAAWQWLAHRRVVSGGSTLTMQVARILEPVPRTVTGKLRQIVRAVQLELRLSKREILALYVNHAPMGGVLEGVESASRAYLGKPALRLTHADAALLAVLPQAPSLLRPDRHPERARQARDKVLHRLAPRWGEAAVRDALLESAHAAAIREPVLAPLLAERLARTHRGKVRIETHVDANVQTAVELMLADRARALPPRVSAAVLVVDNASLAVLAYAGSADFGDDERFSHVDMVRAARSPGSALKPFLYAFALDDGLIHSESLLADAPQSFSGYQPGNFQQSFHGPVSVSEALVRSLNVPAVEVLERLDPVRFVALLRRGGLRLELPRGATPNLSVILGGAGATLENLVGAYTSLARGGVAGRPRFTPDEPLAESRMMSEGAAFIVRDLLETGGPVGRALAPGAGISQGIAWKTGTSFGFRDAWAVGVSDRYTVGVWVGRPDGTPNPGHFGANTAAPLLVDVFAALPEPTRGAPHPRPESVEIARVCWPLGTRFDPAHPDECHVARTAWLLNGVAPPTFPDRLRPGEPRYVFLVDPASGERVAPGCAGPSARSVAAVRWPAALEPWLDASLRARVLPPALSRRCVHARTPEAGLKIAGLTDGEVLARLGDGALVRLEARGQSSDLRWLVNGRVVAHGPAAASLVYRFEAPGRYEITALDAAGRYDRVSVSVR